MADIVPFPQRDDDLEFRVGDTLGKDGRPDQLFVVAVEEGGKVALLVPVGPDAVSLHATKPTFSASLKEMAGWERLYLPGPRLVQAYRVNTHELVWEAYLPDMFAALRLADEIYAEDGVYLTSPREIDLVITTQHHDEDEALLERGYWSNGTIPEWWPKR